MTAAAAPAPATRLEIAPARALMQEPPPLTALQAWLVADIERTQGRIDHAAQIERCERDRYAQRAGRYWDDDRRVLAEEQGERLARRPAKVLQKLRATPQGCDWLLKHWGLLLEICEAGQAWDEGQTSLALDLLGTPANLRDPAIVAPRLADPAGLARAEIQALRVQRSQVADSDRHDRSRAMADLAEPTTPEFRQIRRFEAGLHRRLKWSLTLLGLASPSAEPPPAAVAVDRRERTLAPAASDPTPTPFTPLRPVGPTRGPATPVEVAASPSSPSTRRPDPARLRAKVRQAARARRQDRLDR